MLCAGEPYDTQSQGSPTELKLAPIVAQPFAPPVEGAS